MSIVSELLTTLLDVDGISDEDKHWAQLEQLGYSTRNPFFDPKSDNLPLYRSVVIEVYGQPLFGKEKVLVFKYELGKKLINFSVAEIERRLASRLPYATVDDSTLLEEARRESMLAHEIRIGRSQFRNVLTAVGALARDKLASYQQKCLPNHVHPAVLSAAGELFQDGYYLEAVRNTVIALEKEVKHRSGRTSLIGKDLMTTAFSAKNPLITLDATESVREGYMYLFAGETMALRNPLAHGKSELSYVEAVEWLSFLSALFRKMDAAGESAGGA